MDIKLHVYEPLDDNPVANQIRLLRLLPSDDFAAEV
jgi:hypothetical protein